ncbi:hypothetical protein LRS10_18185 [Phenylobacterium sp. J426]|nr:hypothetical protein [Phenylobacterium sp. J426]MCR5875911.1 hypothetical protein [Phenylobacterium sp. J426]
MSLACRAPALFEQAFGQGEAGEGIVGPNGQGPLVEIARGGLVAFEREGSGKSEVDVVSVWRFGQQIFEDRTCPSVVLTSEVEVG